MTTPIMISRLHFPITTLGPGRRIGIWVQGCSIRCPGCISADTWATDRGATTVEAVLGALGPWFPSAEGITISGGEPFDQSRSLIALLSALRTRSSADILVFTGYAYEVIQPQLEVAAGLIDALISDPFDLSKSQTLGLRGSDNQRLHLLTSLGRERFSKFDREVTAQDRRFDLMLDEEGTIWLVGIPGRDDLHRLQGTLQDRGHRMVTSEDRSTASTRWNFTRQ